MTGLVLFSHGSLLCGAGGALEAHAACLRQEHGFGLVEVGYLNYSEPLFADAVRRLADAGASKIVVVPFFLAPGYFVTHSLPKCIDSVRPDFPEIEFVVAQPLGADLRLADAVLESAGGARTSEYWREGLDEARSACRRNPECPVHGEGCAYPGSHPPVPSPVMNGPHPPAPSPKVGRGGVGSGGGAVLVMVHGSPKAEANDEMFQVVEMARKKGVYSIVEVGFLECNEPTITQAIAACVRQGARRIAAVPYFLHMGNHVAGDLPSLLEVAAAEWPNVEFRMGEYIGRSERLTELLAARAAQALAKEEKHNVR